METIFECTNLNPTVRKRRFLTRLLALPEGRGFVLHSANEVGDLLALMEARYPGMYEHHRVADQPGEHSFVIARRRLHRPQGAVATLLFDDHKMIHSLVDRIESAAKQGTVGRVVVLARQLERLLAAHFEREEELFFPALVQRLGGAGHLVERLRNEHQEGLKLVRLIGQTLAVAGRGIDLEDLSRRATILQGMLQTHARFEDGLFYLLADVLLDDADQRALLERLRAVGDPQALAS